MILAVQGSKSLSLSVAVLGRVIAYTPLSWCVTFLLSASKMVCVVHQYAPLVLLPVSHFFRSVDSDGKHISRLPPVLDLVARRSSLLLLLLQLFFSCILFYREEIAKPKP